MSRVGAPELTILQPGEGEERDLGTIGVVFKLSGEQTNGQVSVVEHPFPVGACVPPHMHTREDESFICLAGQLEVMLGGETFVLGTGDYLLLPRDVVHTFRNPFDDEARVISVVSPAGLEAYYQALADLPPGPKDISVLQAIMADFGIELRLPAGSPS